MSSVIFPFHLEQLGFFVSASDFLMEAIQNELNIERSKKIYGRLAFSYSHGVCVYAINASITIIMQICDCITSMAMAILAKVSEIEANPIRKLAS